MVKFLRRSSKRYKKLGRGRKKKQKWNKPKGRDNKMREKRRGCPVVVSIGYRTGKRLRGTLQGKKPIIVKNISDLKKIQENEIAVMGRIGKKRKIEIAQKAKEMKISFFNLNLKKTLKTQNKKKGIDGGNANEPKA